MSEVLGFYLMGMFGFTIFLIITSLLTLGEKVFTKRIPIYSTLKIIFLATPAYLVLALPVAVLFATLMGMSRFIKDKELVSFSTNGISLYQIFTPFLALAVLTAGVSYTVYEFVVPKLNREFVSLISVFGASQVVDFIRPDIVIRAPDSRYFIVKKVNRDTGKMADLTMYDFTVSKVNPRIIHSAEAEVSYGFLNLKNTRIYEADRSGTYIVSGVANNIQVDIARKLESYSYTMSPQEMSSVELRREIQQLSAAYKARPNPVLKRDLDYKRTELNLKYALPVASIVFILVAVPFSLRGPRDERNMGMIYSFVLVMAYYALFFAFRTFGWRGIVDPLAAAWVPNFAFFIASVPLMIFARK